MNAIGNFTVGDFYISDVKDRSGIDFRMAYEVAKKSKNNKELCACWGSMVCAVSEGRLKVSVENALKRIGIQHREVKLPSEARKYNINVSDVPEMDWPSILVSFCFFILLLFKNSITNSTSKEMYKMNVASYISELKKRIGFDPASAGDMDVPFDFKRAKVIRTMLGANSTLKKTVVVYIMDMVRNINNPQDSGIGIVCEYLCSIFAQTKSISMYDFNIVNEMLVKPQSPVLDDPRVFDEVKNLKEACEAVGSHPHPQFFRLTASTGELWKVHWSRFPNIMVVAQELKWGNDGSTLASYPSVVMMNRTTVQALVKLHLTAMASKTYMLL